MADQPEQRFLWAAFYTAWAQSCSGQWLSEADNRRIWWLPNPLLSGMEDMGLLELCDGHEGRCQNMRYTLDIPKMIGVAFGLWVAAVLRLQTYSLWPPRGAQDG